MLVCIAVGALRPTGHLKPDLGSLVLPAKSSGAPSHQPAGPSTTLLPPSLKMSNRPVAYPVSGTVVGVPGASKPPNVTNTIHLDAGTPDGPNWTLDAGGSLEAPTTGALLDTHLAPASQLHVSPYNLRPRNTPVLRAHSMPPPSLAFEAGLNPVAAPTAGMLGGQIKGRARFNVEKSPKGHGSNTHLGIRHPAGVHKPRKTSKLLTGRGGCILTVCAHVLRNVTWCLWFKMPSL